MSDAETLFDDAERRAIAPVLELLSAMTSPPKWNHERGFVVLRVSESDETCPFEIHVGRDERRYHVSFFMGWGAELHNHESIGDEVAQGDVASDLTRFLTSSIEVEEHITSNGVVRAIYRLDKFRLDEAPIEFVFKNYAWPPLRYREERRVFSPWRRG